MEYTKAPLSCYILTMNSERRLAQVLASVQHIADEVLVIDSGSQDETLAIAQRYNSRILTRPFDNFRDQRVFAEQNCTHDWVLQIDSDEVVSDELAHSIATLKASAFRAADQSTPDGFRVTREWIVMGKKVHAYYPIRAPDQVVRLLRRSLISHRNSRIIHESAAGPSRVIKPIEGSILHYTCDSIDQMYEKTGLYTRLSAQDMHSRAEEASLLKIHVFPWLIAFRYYVLMGGWKDGEIGWVHATYIRHTIYLKYLKLRYDFAKTSRQAASSDLGE